MNDTSVQYVRLNIGIGSENKIVFRELQLCEKEVVVIPSCLPIHKQQLYIPFNRRKESSEVNSLISALDTTLKFTEHPPETDQETQEESADDPGGEYSGMKMLNTFLDYKDMNVGLKFEIRFESVQENLNSCLQFFDNYYF